MKTISCIVAIFLLGLLGWFGFEKKVSKQPEMSKIELLYENDLLIRQKEAQCETLKAQIIEDHKIIESKLSE